MKNHNPAFSMPRDVIADSKTRLEKATRAHDWPQALRSAMDIALAETLINPDSIDKCIRSIGTIRANAPEDALTYRAMLAILEAYVLNEYYGNDRWTFDRRMLPPTPLPAKIDEWSGAQLRTRISSLIDEALAPADALKKSPLRAWEKCLQVENGSEKVMYACYPTAYDFIANLAVKILRTFADRDVYLSPSLLGPWRVVVDASTKTSSPIMTKVLDIYASLINANRDNPAALITSEIERLQYVKNHIYSEVREESDAVYLASLKDLCLSNAGNEWAGLALMAMADEGRGNDDIGQMRWLVAAIGDHIRQYPKFHFTGCLHNDLNKLTEKRVDCLYPMMAAPGSDLKVQVNLSNLKGATLHVYKVPPMNGYFDGPTLSFLTPIQKIDVATTEEQSLPFSDKITASVKLGEAGGYVIVPVAKELNPFAKYTSYPVLTATRLAVNVSSFLSQTAWVIDPLTGAPVEGATVNAETGSYRNSKIIDLGVTGSDGSLPITEKNELFAVKGTDTSTRITAPYFYVEKARKPEWTDSYAAYTALPLYHPGDSVEWAVVAYEHREADHRLCPGKSLFVSLMNASGVEVANSHVTADRFGRASGTFKIPADGLTGSFALRVNGTWVKQFTVSDYKLPTFQVSLEPVERDVPAQGAFTIRGNAKTYSAFPLTDATVKIVVTAQRKSAWGWWHLSSPGVQFFETTVTTDAAGDFSAVLPEEAVRQCPIPNALYVAEVTVMSATGESHDANTAFTSGLRYVIEASAKEDDIDISEPVKSISARVVDYSGNAADIPVTARVCRDGDTLATITDLSKPWDLTGLPSGKCTIEFAVADSTLAAPTSLNVVLYRPSDTATPTPGTLLWTPVRKVAAGESWLFATDCSAYMLLTLHTADAVLWQRWQAVGNGMHTLDPALPEGIDEAELSVCLAGDYRSDKYSLKVYRPQVRKTLKVVAESFRDRLVPGQNETWTFKLLDTDGKPLEGAVIADMYNTALDALASSSWTFSPEGYARTRSYSWKLTDLSRRINSYCQHVYKNYKCNDMPELWFETYGYGFGMMPRYANFKMETVAMPCMSRGMADDMADSIAGSMEDSVIEEEAKVERDAGAETPQEPAPKQPDFEYRDSETPLAFFKPMLVSDAQGHLAITFTVPNANTTWGFRALAYTEELLTANYSADVVAAKPVMVQPNLPRFLRTDDTCQILANVMNASDTALAVATTVEIFNPADGSVIETATFENDIEAGGSATVSHTVRVPASSPFIGYRIKASSGTFADGEQALIPVLPSSSPVIETTPFYIAPGQGKFSLGLSAVPDSAKVTLQYCDNPIWYVVTALPGIIERDASTASEAGASIFSLSVALGLLRDNPAIEEALKTWTASSDKSSRMLTSMLEQNEDLKQVLLSATPWMLNAKDDTERMTRLALLFDRPTIESTMRQNIAKLEKLSRPGGGWAWHESCDKASEWATENVLLMIGHLLRLGFLPEEPTLAEMAKQSLRYIDKETLKGFKKYPEDDYWYYVYMRGFFKGFGPSPDAGIARAEVKYIRKHWEHASLFEKAVYANILNREGHGKEAADILQSLIQYAEYKPEKGMWWPSLYDRYNWSMEVEGTTAIIMNTFTDIMPESEYPDRIRQWLLLQKEAQDWGSSVTTVQVVAAILHGAAKWTVPAGETTVKVGRTPVKPDDVEALTGYFRTDLDLKAHTEPTLTVDRSQPATPAWGAVYYQFIQRSADIKSHRCNDLSIEKQLVAIGSDGTPLALGSDLTLGGRVRVTLTIRAERDLDYVTMVDERPACFEPVEQLPRPLYSEGIAFYRENRDSSTRLFITHLPKGVYVLSYDMWVNNAGDFTSGIATVQSQYAPQFTAHSSGGTMRVAR